MVTTEAMTRRVQVGLIDDHPLFRQGLAAVLAREAGVVVAGEACNEIGRAHV